MSWVELRGEKWAPTPDEAKINLCLWRPDAGCARQSWTWHVQHVIRQPRNEEGKPIGTPAFVSVEVSNLHLQMTDWRRLEGREIRSTAAWRDAHEETHEYGRDNTAELEVMALLPRDEPDENGCLVRRAHWLAHDFTLRFGRRDGWSFPCELDAWIIPRDEYWRTVPETPAEVTRFGEGPPNLRVITRAVFGGGTVHVPRIPGDPVAWAARALREEIGCDAVHDAHVHWASRQKPVGGESEKMPGWTSSVSFGTRRRE